MFIKWLRINDNAYTRDYIELRFNFTLHQGKLKIHISPWEWTLHLQTISLLFNFISWHEFFANHGIPRLFANVFSVDVLYFNRDETASLARVKMLNKIGNYKAEVRAHCQEIYIWKGNKRTHCCADQYYLTWILLMNYGKIIFTLFITLNEIEYDFLDIKLCV